MGRIGDRDLNAGDAGDQRSEEERKQAGQALAAEAHGPTNKPNDFRPAPSVPPTVSQQEASTPSDGRTPVGQTFVKENDPKGQGMVVGDRGAPPNQNVPSVPNESVGADTNVARGRPDTVKNGPDPRSGGDTLPKDGSGPRPGERGGAPIDQMDEKTVTKELGSLGWSAGIRPASPGQPASPAPANDVRLATAVPRAQAMQLASPSSASDARPASGFGGQPQGNAGDKAGETAGRTIDGVDDWARRDRQKSEGQQGPGSSDATAAGAKSPGDKVDPGIPPPADGKYSGSRQPDQGGQPGNQANPQDVREPARPAAASPQADSGQRNEQANVPAPKSGGTESRAGELLAPRADSVNQRAPNAADPKQDAATTTERIGPSSRDGSASSSAVGASGTVKGGGEVAWGAVAAAAAGEGAVAGAAGGGAVPARDRSREDGRAGQERTAGEKAGGEVRPTSEAAGGGLGPKSSDPRAAEADPRLIQKAAGGAGDPATRTAMAHPEGTPATGAGSRDAGEKAGAAQRDGGTRAGGLPGDHGVRTGSGARDGGVTGIRPGQDAGRTDISDKVGSSPVGTVRADGPITKVGEPPSKAGSAGGPEQPGGKDAKGMGISGGKPVDVPPVVLPPGLPGVQLGGKGLPWQISDKDPTAGRRGVAADAAGRAGDKAGPGPAPGKDQGAGGGRAGTADTVGGIGSRAGSGRLPGQSESVGAAGKRDGSGKSPSGSDARGGRQGEIPVVMPPGFPGMDIIKGILSGRTGKQSGDASSQGTGESSPRGMPAPGGKASGDSAGKGEKGGSRDVPDKRPADGTLFIPVSIPNRYGVTDAGGKGALETGSKASRGEPAPPPPGEKPPPARNAAPERAPVERTPFLPVAIPPQYGMDAAARRAGELGSRPARNETPPSTPADKQMPGRPEVADSRMRDSLSARRADAAPTAGDASRPAAGAGQGSIPRDSAGAREANRARESSAAPERPSPERKPYQLPSLRITGERSKPHGEPSGKEGQDAGMRTAAEPAKAGGPMTFTGIARREFVTPHKSGEHGSLPVAPRTFRLVPAEASSSEGQPAACEGEPQELEWKEETEVTEAPSSAPLEPDLLLSQLDSEIAVERQRDLQPAPENIYIVQPGDTLESIADRRLFDSMLALLLHEKNKERIQTRFVNGERVLALNPGTVLRLPTNVEIREFRNRLAAGLASIFKYESEFDTPEQELAAWEQAKKVSSDDSGSIE